MPNVITPGTRLQSRRTHRIVRVIEPADRSGNGAIPQSPGWSCVYEDTWTPTRLQEHTIRKDWEVVE